MAFARFTLNVGFHAAHDTKNARPLRCVVRRARFAGLAGFAFLPAESLALQVTYARDVAPLLVERCYECHSAEKKTKGGLALDTAEAVRKGGDTGPALVAGDPLFDEMEQRLAASPAITVPTITLEGSADGVAPVGGRAASLLRFTGHHENRVVANAGHNLPQEAPDEFAQAILEVRA